jgi:hypothetical protein
MKVFPAWFSFGAPASSILVENGGVTMDRFDARHLLNAPVSEFSGGGTSRLDNALDELRFQDLHAAQMEAARNKRRKTEDEADRKQEPSHPPPPPPSPPPSPPSAAAAAPAPASLAPQSVYDPNAGFECPFDVPREMVLPESEKIHTVIMSTVQFVIQHGPNSITELRRRQANNPMFGFLDSDDKLHPCKTSLSWYL